MYSMQEAVSDGTLVQLPVSIQYLDKTHISITLNGVPHTAYSWQGNIIVFSAPVPNGVKVLLTRSTPTDELIHIFTGGVDFTDKTVDESLRQQLFLNQEANEQQTDAVASAVVAAQAAAGNALAYANSAAASATTALGAASAADTSAIIATDNAVIAVGAASSAAATLADIQTTVEGYKPNVIQFTGNGVQTQFDLGISVADEDLTQVFVAGVYMPKTTYSITSLHYITFNTAPANGAVIEVNIVPSVAYVLSAYEDWGLVTDTPATSEDDWGAL